MSAPSAGWYVDGVGTLRWWDGAAWGPVAPFPPAPPRDNTTLAVVSHLGTVFGSFVLPLVVRLTGGTKDAFVRHHATEALNFQITYLVVYLVAVIGGSVLTFASIDVDGPSGSVGPPIAFFAVFGAVLLMALGALVLTVVAAVRASQGRWFRYPVTIRFVRGAASRVEAAERDRARERA